MTNRGNSSCDACKTNRKSPCPVQVGIPVEGPGRIASTMTIGTSIMAAMPTASVISEKPPPEVAVIARTPAYPAPMTVVMADI